MKTLPLAPIYSHFHAFPCDTFRDQRGEDGVMGRCPPHVLQDLLHRGGRRAGGQHHALLGLGAHPWGQRKGELTRLPHLQPELLRTRSGPAPRAAHPTAPRSAPLAWGFRVVLDVGLSIPMKTTAANRCLPGLAPAARGSAATSASGGRARKCAGALQSSPGLRLPLRGSPRGSSPS